MGTCNNLLLRFSQLSVFQTHSWKVKQSLVLETLIDKMFLAPKVSIKKKSVQEHQLKKVLIFMTFTCASAPDDTSTLSTLENANPVILFW